MSQIPASRKISHTLFNTCGHACVSKRTEEIKIKRRREGRETAEISVTPPLSPSVLEGDETLISLQMEELWSGSSGVTVSTESVVDLISKLFL